MIIAFIGQPCSGKTTMCRDFYGYLRKNIPCKVHYIDGDKLRYVFANKDYSKEGRLANLKLAVDIARYEESLNDIVLMSLVFPYKESREYLRQSIKTTLIIYLHYDSVNDVRGRENFHVEDFDIPTDADLVLNTTVMSEEDCLNAIINCYKLKVKNK